MNAAQPSRRNVRLVRISHVGLKARDAVHDLGAVSLLVGENGRGKSSVIDALHLLVNGFVPNVDKTNDGIFTLCRKGCKELRVEGWLEMSDGREVHVSRAWKRATRGGKITISQEIRNSEVGGSLDEHRIWLASHLGALTEAWDPSVFIDLTPSKMREKLLRLLPDSNAKLEQIVPADCPSWALPKHVDPEPNVWVRWAIEKTQEQIADRQKSIREQRVELENVADAWKGEKPIDPIKNRLAALRKISAGVKAREVLSAQVEALQDAIAEAFSFAKEPAPSVGIARLFHAINEAVVCMLRSDLKTIDEKAAQIRRELAPLERRLEAIRGADTPTETVEECDALLAEYNDDRTRIRSTIASLEKDVARYTEPVVSTCPHCQGDLKALFAKERDRRNVEIEDAKAELQLVASMAMSVQTAREHAKILVERTEVEAKVVSLSVALDELNARRASLPEAPLPGVGPWPLVDEAEFRADAALDAALHKQRALEQLGELQARLKAVTLDRDTYQKAEQTTEEIEASIKALESELQALTLHNDRAKRLKNAEDDISKFEAQVEDLKAWLVLFTRIQSELVAKTKAWIEGAMTEILGGAKVVVELVDARDRDDCRFTVDGVDAATLSVGKRVLFVAGLVIVLASASDAPWRPLILDEFEHVSRMFREPFIAAIQGAVADGRLSQSIIAGCCDIRPNVEGVTVIDLDLAVEVAA